MKEIQLSKLGKYKGLYVALVDDADYEWLNQFRWNAQKGRDTYYARRNFDGTHFLMHRLIMGVTDRQVYVDHINDNGLDNRRDNLRTCTNSQNVINARKKKTFKGKPLSSKYKGVTWVKLENKWMAQAKIAGVNKYLGLFNNEIDAALAYNEFAKENFGEFARLNEIDSTQYKEK